MEDRRDLDPAPPARRTATAAAAPPETGLGGPGTSRDPARRDTESPVLVENSAIAVDLVFHADCWYSLISPASLGRSWIRSARTGRGTASGSSPGARRPMPWP